MLVLIIMEKLVCSNLNRKKKVKNVSDYLKKVFYQIMLNQFKQLFYLKSVGVIYSKAFFFYLYPSPVCVLCEVELKLDKKF